MYGLLLIVLISLFAFFTGGIFDRVFSLSLWGNWQTRHIEKVYLAEKNPVLKWFVDAAVGLNFDVAFFGRPLHWYQAVKSAFIYPLGIGRRASIFSPYSLPHNQFLQALAEEGWLGFLIFILLIRQILRDSRTLADSNTGPLQSTLGNGIYLSMVGLIIMGLFGESFVGTGMAALWFLIGLMVVLSTNSRGLRVM
jgi:hypothetical protein